MNNVAMAVRGIMLRLESFFGFYLSRLTRGCSADGHCKYCWLRHSLIDTRPRVTIRGLLTRPLHSVRYETISQ